MEKEKKEVEDPGEQADDKESKATEQSEEGSSLTTEQKTEDLDEMISSMLMQDFDREVVEKGICEPGTALPAYFKQFYQTSK